MDDLWNRFFSDFPVLRKYEGEWAPSVDVSEDKENFIVQAELPGVDQKDVNVTVSGNMLTVKKPDYIGGTCPQTAWSHSSPCIAYVQ
jgi:HSP20 family protein